MTADGENVRSEIRGTSQGWSVAVQGDGPTVPTSWSIAPTEAIYRTLQLPAGEENSENRATIDATVVRIVQSSGNVIDGSR